MEILFENRNLVAVVKDRNILSQKSEKQQENMVDILEEKYGCEIFPVHRLDKPVGGVMVYAKNKRSAAELSKQITDGKFKKTYLAVVEGEPEEDKGELEDLLYFDKQKNKSFVVKKERKGVKKASLDYEVIEKNKAEEKALTLVKVHLHTGRTHQIRVQFASRKLPIVGDSRYGSENRGLPIALWSYSIELFDIDGKKLIFSALPEKDDGAFGKFNDALTEK